MISSFALKANDSISVYLFLLDDCIICQSYSPKLNTLYQNYGQDYKFIGLFPNFSSKPQKIKEFKEKYNIQFELKTDYWKTMVKKFGIEVTPEVIVYDERKDRILYKGRIDNEFAALGKRRKIVTTDELNEVLATLLSGDKRTFAFTEAVGCFINQNDPTK
jgi:peroxiredoxin